MKKQYKAALLCLAAVCAAGCSQSTQSSMPQDSTASSAITTQTEASTPETKASETEAPKTEVPETKAPETEAPETEAPETEAPQTEAPETEAPETQAPETEAPETQAPETQPPTESETLEAINSYRRIGENGILVAGMDGHYRGIMFYGGTYGYCDRYIYDVKQFKEALPEVNVYSMVIPTSVDFYNPEEYRGHTAFQKDKIDYIEQELSSSRVKNVSVYDALQSHADEKIYARTDHHWMPLGAYYAAECFAKAADFKMSELSEYRAATYGGYVGSMYYYSQDSALYNDPEDYTVYYSPNEDKLTTTYYNRYFSNGYESDLFIVDNASYYYLTFLGSDDLIAHVKTDAESGRNLVVIKESYGNALIPFLTEGFDNIYVLDLRYCEVNAVDFCKQVGATDLLFANCAYTVAGGNCEYFEYIRTR